MAIYSIHHLSYPALNSIEMTNTLLRPELQKKSRYSIMVTLRGWSLIPRLVILQYEMVRLEDENRQRWLLIILLKWWLVVAKSGNCMGLVWDRIWVIEIVASCVCQRVWYSFLFIYSPIFPSPTLSFICSCLSHQNSNCKCRLRWCNNIVGRAHWTTSVSIRRTWKTCLECWFL